MGQPFISSTLYSHNRGFPVVSYEVLYEGVKYRCDTLQLNMLYQGTDPLDLDLERLDEADDD